VQDLADDALVGEPGNKVISSSLLTTVFGVLGLSSTTSVVNGAVYLFNGVQTTGIVSGASPYWTFFDNTGASVDLIGEACTV